MSTNPYLEENVAQAILQQQEERQKMQAALAARAAQQMQPIPQPQPVVQQQPAPQPIQIKPQPIRRIRREPQTIDEALQEQEDLADDAAEGDPNIVLA